MLQSHTKKIVEEDTSEEMPISGPVLGDCLCGNSTFLKGTKIPHWGGRTCSAGELEWACKKGDGDGGKKYLKAICCDDPNVGSCLCGTWKFYKGKKIKAWGNDRTCSAQELSWACDRPDSDGGKSYLKAECCEDPDLGACLCGSAAKFQKGKTIRGWGGGRTCSAQELNWACKKPDSNGGKKYLKRICCKD